MHFPTLTQTVALALTLALTLPAASALHPSPTPARALAPRSHNHGLTSRSLGLGTRDAHVHHRELAKRVHAGESLVSAREEEGDGDWVWEKRDAEGGEEGEKEMTNGERMKRGLPPKKPLWRRQTQTGAPAPRPSARPPTTRTSSTGTCTPRTGVIRVSGGGFEGYLSRQANAFGEYVVQRERGNALRVVLADECNVAEGGSGNVRAVNGFVSFPLLGAIEGFSSDNADLRPNTRNYLYIGGVAQSAAGARPAVVGNSFSATTGDAEASESAIWVVGANGEVTVRWVNPDGTTPANQVVYVGGRNVLAVVGDVSAFVAAVEDASPVALTFVV